MRSKPHIILVILVLFILLNQSGKVSETTYDARNVVLLGSFVDFEIFRGLEYEMLICQFKDGLNFQIVTLYTDRKTGMTGLSKHSVWVNSVYIINMLQVLRREMWELDLVIHNHPTDPKISPGDKQCLDELREVGFVGKFLIWCKGEVKEY